MARARIHALLLAAALGALGYAAYRFRAGYIRSFFVPGAGGGPPPALALPDDPALATRGLPPAGRVRVVLLDGVDRVTAAGLPAYSSVCARGLDLVVDVGFPTVSLPVQHVLWTGLTQQQTGVLFFYKLLPPPANSIPAQVPDSIAVAESHGKITHSTGFATALPLDPNSAPPYWSLETAWRPWLDFATPRGFERAADEAITGDARLAFVHILRTDSVAHKAGRDSRAFRDVAASADALLGHLLADEARAHPDGKTRWFVLADHGHRAGGGHGGPEPRIRTVRACIAGDLPADLKAPTGAYLHMVDFSRALADSVGATPDPRSAGRPLYAALAAPVDRDATLPRATLGAWLAAAALLLVAMLFTAWAARGGWGALPWWWPVAYLSLVTFELVPSLSTHMIYQKSGRMIYLAALPGLMILAVATTRALRRTTAARATIAALALPAAAALAALILSGGAPQLVGLATDPPLVPRWTAQASVFLVLGFTACAVVALALVASAALFGSGPSTPWESRDRGS